MDKKLLIDEYLQGKHPIEGKKWELPTAEELDRDEALFDALVAEKKQASRFTKTIGRTLLAIAAVLVAVLALFTWKSHKPQNQPQLAEKTEEIAPQENTPKVVEKRNVVKTQTSNVTIANVKCHVWNHPSLRLPTKHRPRPKLPFLRMLRTVFTTISRNSRTRWATAETVLALLSLETSCKPTNASRAW